MSFSPSEDSLTPLAQRYVLALRASPLTLQIVAMLKKKLGPRLDHEREDVDSIVGSVLNHRDLVPILENYLGKATHGAYIFGKMFPGVQVSYHREMLTFSFTVLGESFKWDDRDYENNEEQRQRLSDPHKAEKVLERATGANLTFIGRDGDFQRDPGDYDTYMRYDFKVALPMPKALFFTPAR